MFDLTVLDYVFVGVILASTIWATIRGGVYETIATLSHGLWRRYRRDLRPHGWTRCYNRGLI